MTRLGLLTRLRGRPRLSAKEFERRYAARSDLTVAELRGLGRVVKRCRCYADDCEGWQSISTERVAEAEVDWKAGRYHAPDWKM